MSANIIKLSSPATKEFWKIPVLWEDEALLALDKPSQLLTSPDRYDAARPNLMGLLHRDIARPAPWVVARSVSYLANAHRLDFETSGILLLAKSKPALIALANQFGTELPRKKYFALVEGSPAADEFTVDEKLAPHPLRLGQIRVDEKRGKRSTTHFKVLERFQRHTWVECRPVTGRTHQIRVHLQHAKTPVAGDSLYGGHELLLSKLKRDFRLKKGQVERPLISRVALHAAELEMEHPVTGRQVAINSPLAHDLAVALKFLRKHALSGPVTPFAIPVFGPLETPEEPEESE